MNTLFRVIAFSLLGLLSTSCVGLVGGKKSANANPFLLLFGLGSGSESGNLPAPTNASTEPEVAFPGGTPVEGVTIDESAIPLPLSVAGTFVPVGKVYEVGMDMNAVRAMDPALEAAQGLQFPDHPAQLTFKYDRDELASAGFAEEFQVFYFDQGSERWLAVERVIVNTASSEVYALTTHMTPFVLTAVPSASGTQVAEPPACIAADFPPGSITSDAVSAGWTPQLTQVGFQFRYYQDRIYHFDSAPNIDALGFEGALAISTCNGSAVGGGFCEDQLQHKQYEGVNYLRFTAHANIDVYVMYDVRQGVDFGTGFTDNSFDPAWLRDHWVHTNTYVQSTDAVGQYRVYYKQFNQGEVVALHGNRNGLGPFPGQGANTNYWVVIKRAGVTGNEPAAMTCEAQRDPDLPGTITNLIAIPGATKMILRWQNPDDADFQVAVLRRGAAASAPLTPSAGVDPTGTSLSEQSYIDDGLTLGTTYCYTVFALDANNNNTQASVCATTEADTDGDGLADSYEDAVVYPTTLKSDRNDTTTDTDAMDDGEEVALGRDPTNGDDLVPDVTIFSLLSFTPTTDQYVQWDLQGTDDVGITQWMITHNSTKPLATHTGWLAAKPAGEVMNTTGTHSYYAWAKDAAGNVSMAEPVLDVNLEGIKEAKFAYVLTQDSIRVIGVDSPGNMTQIQSTSASPSLPALHLHPGVRSMYVESDPTTYWVVDPSTGMLSGMNWLNIASAGGESSFAMALHPNGRYLYQQILDEDACGSECGQYKYAIYNVDPATGLPTALQGALGSVMGYAGKLFVTPAGSALYNAASSSIAEVLSLSNPAAPTQIQTFGLPSPVGGVVCPSAWGVAQDSTRRTTYIVGRNEGAQARLIQMDANGLNVSSSILPLPAQACDAVVHPSGRFLYITHPDANQTTVHQIGAGGNLTLIQILPASGPGPIAIDDGGQKLFTTSAAAGVMSFSIDLSSGMLTPASTLPTPAPQDVAIVSSHDANDPPMVHAGKNRWIWYYERAYLHGHFTFDPDAARCNANAANYVAQWRFQAVPPTSSFIVNSSAGITNANSLTGAYFQPDRRGTYILRLEFTDDPGSCIGAAKTRTATVQIDAGQRYELRPSTYPFTYQSYDTPPARPGAAPPDAVFVEPAHGIYLGGPVINQPWTMISRAFGEGSVQIGSWTYVPYPLWQIHEYGNLTAWQIWLRPPFAWPVCPAPPRPWIEAVKYCNERVLLPYIAEWHRTRYTRLYAGVWQWWRHN